MRYETKLFEVRDKGTFLPIAATRVCVQSVDSATPIRPAEAWLMERSGWGGVGSFFIHVWRLDGGEGMGYTDPFEHSRQARTMQVAHRHLHTEWDHLTTGSVIDVEYLLEETEAPKLSERATEPPVGPRQDIGYP